MRKPSTNDRLSELEREVERLSKLVEGVVGVTITRERYTQLLEMETLFPILLTEARLQKVETGR